ncbi:MAG: 4Fe-4S binding protein [candidate division WOR-3 bacterium]
MINIVGFLETFFQLKYLVRKEKKEFLFTGDIKLVVPSLDKEKCNFCKLCVDICPTKSFKIKEENLIFEITKCINCCLCIEECPQNAFRKDHIKRIVLKRKDYNLHIV